MQFASLGSGSRGNGTLVRSGNICVLVDCGFALRQCCARLARRDVDPESVDAILVTHEHADHARGVRALATRFDIPVYTTIGTAVAMDWPLDELHLIGSEQRFRIADLEIRPVPVPHDAREPVQYVFSDSQHTLGVLTDTGHVTGHILDCYAACDALLVEFNHDVHMLRTGNYPAMVKRRVEGPLGHLSNDQSAELVRALAAGRLSQVAIGHISEQNNTVEHVLGAIERVACTLGHGTVLADQSDGLDWQRVRTPALAAG